MRTPGSRALDRIADEFELAPTLYAPPARPVLVVPGRATGPLEDETTKPLWIRTPPGHPAARAAEDDPEPTPIPASELPLATSDRAMLTNLIKFVGATKQGHRAGAVARALRTVLKHFCASPEARLAAIEYLGTEAIRLDIEGDKAGGGR